MAERGQRGALKALKNSAESPQSALRGKFGVRKWLRVPERGKPKRIK